MMLQSPIEQTAVSVCQYRNGKAVVNSAQTTEIQPTSQNYSKYCMKNSKPLVW